jgi:hypothetical protein
MVALVVSSEERGSSAGLLCDASGEDPEDGIVERAVLVNIAKVDCLLPGEELSAIKL